MKAKTAGVAAGYTLLNFRFVALVMPAAAVAYLVGQTWLVVAAGVLLVLALGAELVTAVASGLAAANQYAAANDYLDDYFAELEKHANGGWVGLNGDEGEGEGEGPDEGEEEGGEGPTSVPAK